MKRSRILHVVAAGVLLTLAPVLQAQEIRSLEDVIGLQQKVEAVGKKVMPSVVALISVSAGSSGSGVLVRPDGLILTAAHVVDGSEELDVVFPDGKQFKAQVIGANYSKDIGMAKIIDKGEWPAIELGRSKTLKAGDWVVAMGHSEGYDPARTPPLRFGRVVSTGPGNFLTSDCKLIGGDSGGPLFDLNGKLVGINSSIGLSTDNNNHAGIDGFLEDWDRLLAGESWGQLQLNPLANPERAVLGISMGAARGGVGVPVDQVVSGSPAAQAGLRAGDIITGINGKTVRGGQDLSFILAKHTPGDVVEVAVRRGREESKINVKLIEQQKIFEMLER